MQITIERQKRYEYRGCDRVQRSHIGRLASYPLMAAEAGMIGMIWADSGRSPKV